MFNCKTLLSKLCFAAFLILAAAASANAGNVIVITKGGDQYEVEVANFDRISFGETSLQMIPKSGDDTTVPYADVEKILFNSTSGISGIVKDGNIAVWPKTVSDVLYVSGAPEGTRVAVYSQNGMLITSGVANGETLTLDLQAAPSGVCVVSVGKESVKIIKR